MAHLRGWYLLDCGGAHSTTHMKVNCARNVVTIHTWVEVISTNKILARQVAAGQVPVPHGRSLSFSIAA